MKKAFIVAGLATGMMLSAPLASEASAAALGVSIQTGAHVQTVDYRHGPKQGGHHDNGYHRGGGSRHDNGRYGGRNDHRGNYAHRPPERPHYRSFSHWRPRYTHRFNGWGRPVYYAHHRNWGPAYRVRAYDRARDRAVVLWISAVTGAILLSQY